MSAPPESQAPAALLCVCAWCGRWRDAAGGWHPPPAHLAPGQGVTHGMCPPCVLAQLADDTPAEPLR